MKQHLCNDLIVVELAGVLAGPAVGLFFAELGATVYKVENPNGGDVTRSWRLPSESSSAQSAYYSSVNYGKKVVWADLENAVDFANIQTLIQKADIVVTNFKKSSAERLKMTNQNLLQLNPRLIIAEISGYGPDDETPAFDVVLQAETGFMHLNGSPNDLPTKMPVALIDLLAAHQLKEGVLLALWQRERTGQGTIVHISLRDAALASLANQATNWLMAGVSPQRAGSLHPNIAPYGEILVTNDAQFIVLAVGTDRHFAALCNVLNVVNLTNDERFQNNSNRVQNRITLLEQLNAAAQNFDIATLLPLLKQKNVPCGRINDLPTVFADPATQRLLLAETLENGQKTQRVATAVFDFHAVSQ